MGSHASDESQRTMTTNEIRPKQLRALLLLLFLVPLIPTAMMARFMADALKGERSIVAEALEKNYGNALSNALSTTDAADAETVLAHLLTFLDPSVTVRIVDERGLHISGEGNPWGNPLAQSPVRGHPGWMVVVHLKSNALIDDSVLGQRRLFAWTLGLTAAAVITIAGLAVLALRRQLALQELKNTSVATVAHELRTPLASMRMLVDTLREGRFRNEDKLREYLDLIATENERLGRLAENFLTFSRLEKGAQSLHLSTVSPSEIANAAIGRMKGRLAGCEFVTDIQGGLPTLHVDRDELVSALCNLLDNAIKYTGDEKRISLSVIAMNRGVRFRIEDNGIGIEKAHQSAVFRPFYQADQRLTRTREGCGLGLAIVQRIVDAHNGRISIESEAGNGAAISVWIPS